MEFNEYQKAANRTLYGNEQVLTNCALGLAGESGQLIDLIQDYTFKGKDLDKENIETLNKRYPNGFTAGM